MSQSSGLALLFGGIGFTLTAAYLAKLHLPIQTIIFISGLVGAAMGTLGAWIGGKADDQKMAAAERRALRLAEKREAKRQKAETRKHALVDTTAMVEAYACPAQPFWDARTIIIAILVALAGVIVGTTIGFLTV